MPTATPGNTGLARRLLALERARGGPSDAGPGAAFRVCDQLRGPLAKLTGPAGFHSLLSRAVALARAENPTLASVQVRGDGTLAGLDAGPAARGGAESGVEVVAQLLGLLETFIGVPLTMRIVGDAWPELSATDGVERTGGNHE